MGFVVWVVEGLGVDADGFGVPGLLGAVAWGEVVGEVVLVLVDESGWSEAVDDADGDVVAAPLPVGWPPGGVQPTSAVEPSTATEHIAAVPATMRNRRMTLI